ncbi:hypothetical protein I302_104808 [Kwoniella bestiolae CBS 10118]|uniref:Uncharacterized protein n=1 Tax=Kwoniella bestiolae CBS 10118 TaxID=1296100 RepID=A0A1B9FRQ2_9TREE|nr:hypothetical protein I302_09123 [Kwoniella bestiolae CBS 10118]OCF21444.1 hypothetical protein I302_09123 [Kwoniella bestiolae CBS 10118]
MIVSDTVERGYAHTVIYLLVHTGTTLNPPSNSANEAIRLRRVRPHFDSARVPTFAPPPPYTTSSRPLVTTRPPVSTKGLYPYPIFDGFPDTKVVDLQSIDLTKPQGGHWPHANDQAPKSLDVKQGITRAMQDAKVDWDFTTSQGGTSTHEVVDFDFPGMKQSLQQYADAHMKVAERIMPLFRDEAAKKLVADGWTYKDFASEACATKWKEHLYPYAEICKQVCDTHPDVKWRKEKALSHWTAFSGAPEQFSIEEAFSLNLFTKDMEELSEDKFLNLNDNLDKEYDQLYAKFAGGRDSKDPEFINQLKRLMERDFLMSKFLWRRVTEEESLHEQRE